MGDAVIKTASLSADRVYRYELDRRWGSAAPLVFVMLNPSTADAEVDDRTIRRCMGFARDWNYDGIKVVNLFAYRTAYPKELWAAGAQGVDIIGPDNNEHIRAAVADSDVVCAWGAQSFAVQRAQVVLDLIHNIKERVTPGDRSEIWRLGPITKDGHPRHPLYLPKATMAQRHP